MFDPRGHAGLQEDARLEVDLREALGRDELSLVFQPVVDLYDGRITHARGARALEPSRSTARSPPRGSSRSPSRRRCAAIWAGGCCAPPAPPSRAGAPAGADPPPVSVNVSPRELARPGFAREAARDSRRRPGSPTHTIMLEITGTAGAAAAAVARRRHRRPARQRLPRAAGRLLLRLGVAPHLEEFRVSGVKIDRSLTLRLGDDAYPRALVSAILGMGRTLGLRVIVDGVETPEQAELLRGLGCRQGQGWLFSRPLPADRIPDVLHDRAPMPGTGEDQTMSLGAAVEALGVSASTVRRRIAEGHLAASRTQGGHRRLRRSDVERERRRTYQGPIVRAAAGAERHAPRDRRDPGRARPVDPATSRCGTSTSATTTAGSARPAAAPSSTDWLAELGGGLCAGAFGQVTNATTVLLDAARDAGVSLAERVSLLDGDGPGDARRAVRARGPRRRAARLDPGRPRAPPAGVPGRRRRRRLISPADRDRRESRAAAHGTRQRVRGGASARRRRGSAPRRAR